MNKDLQLLKKFFRYLRPHRIWIYFALAAIPFSTASALLIPWMTVRIVDVNLAAKDLPGLYLSGGLLLLVVVVGYGMDAFYTYSLQRSGQYAIADMKTELFTHCLTLPRSYFDHNPMGGTLSRMTSDMEAIGESLAMGVLSLFTDLIKTLALFALLAYLSWKLTLVIMVALPLVYFLVSFLRKRLRTYFNQSRSALAEATSYLTECLNGIKMIQLFAAENKVTRIFKGKNNQFLQAQRHSNIYDAVLFSTIEGMTSVTLALVIWQGAELILAGAITIGVLIGFMQTLNKIFIPIREFAQQIAMIQRALSALEHIEQLFNEPSEKEERQGPKLTGFAELRFNQVGFAYSESADPVLKEISFHLKKGQKLALVGATGSGKSTILRLISKTYGGYEGQIQLNGRELKDLSKTSLLRCVSLMQQDVYLFNESLAFNIGLERPGIGQKEIEEAAAFVYADRFIQNIPAGYQHKVMDNGRNLSAGQAQLISFARTIAGHSELILLDEATSNVDSVTENLIQLAIEKIFQEKTVIAVAHRLSTITKSDLILVMKQGRIIERGTHESLTEQGGYYLELLKELEKPKQEA